MRNHFVTTLGVFALTTFASAQAPQSAAPQPFVAGTPLERLVIPMNDWNAITIVELDK